MATKITEKMVVRDLVVQYPGLRLVMEKLGVDYCCGGLHTLKEAAAEKGVDLKKVLDGLNAALAEPLAQNAKHKDWTAAPLTELVDHIVNRHHTFLKEQMPRLEMLLGKVLRAHGAHHGTMLRALEAAFVPLKAEMDEHLVKEEQVLFPAIRHLVPGMDATLSGPISQMQVEHESAGRALARMREATSNYKLPADACPTFAALYDGFAEVEADLHEHIHLENNILFPRALEH